MRRLLLTPGPLTTSETTRRAMATDWGSREPDFIDLTADLHRRLLKVVNADHGYAAVSQQGSGTFVVEAALGTLTGPQDKLLVLVNGAYGERMAAIARRLGRAVETLTWPEARPVDASSVAEALAGDLHTTHVAMVHCETTTGLENPLAEVAEVVHRAGRRLLIDAMSSFGLLPIDLVTTPVAAVLASSNKGLQGTPGLGFAIIAKSVLERSAGVSASTSLDLHAQWRGFQDTGQWRFTPPVQVVAALVQALVELDEEGGAPARLERCRANFETLSRGMTTLGFELYLDPAYQAPIIATFREPKEGQFNFQAFYQSLAQRGFVIYPGKLTREPSFRVGCIGAVWPADFVRFIEAVTDIWPPKPALSQSVLSLPGSPAADPLSALG